MYASPIEARLSIAEMNALAQQKSLLLPRHWHCLRAFATVWLRIAQIAVEVVSCHSMAMTTSSSGPDLPRNRPLYVFALPSEILDVLTLRTVQQSLPEAESNENQDEQAEEVTSTGLGCQTCAIGAFDSVTEQRKHFRSDWHRYNLKLKSAKSSSKPLKEDEFDAMADGA